MQAKYVEFNIYKLFPRFIRKEILYREGKGKGVWNKDMYMKSAWTQLKVQYCTVLIFCIRYSLLNVQKFIYNSKRFEDDPNNNNFITEVIKVFISIVKSITLKKVVGSPVWIKE